MPSESGETPLQRNSLVTSNRKSTRLNTHPSPEFTLIKIWRELFATWSGHEFPARRVSTLLSVLEEKMPPRRLAGTVY